MKVGKEIQLEIGDDLLEYGVSSELNEMSKLLDRAYLKSNACAIKDLLKDMYESFDVMEKIREEDVDA